MDDDTVDDEAMIFTEKDVYVITGYCADRWNVPDDENNTHIIATTEKAIKFALGLD